MIRADALPPAERGLVRETLLGVRETLLGAGVSDPGAGLSGRTAPSIPGQDRGLGRNRTGLGQGAARRRGGAAGPEAGGQAGLRDTPGQ